MSRCHRLRPRALQNRVGSVRANELACEMAIKPLIEPVKNWLVQPRSMHTLDHVWHVLICSWDQSIDQVLPVKLGFVRANRFVISKPNSFCSIVNKSTKPCSIYSRSSQCNNLLFFLRGSVTTYLELFYSQHAMCVWCNTVSECTHASLHVNEEISSYHVKRILLFANHQILTYKSIKYLLAFAVVANVVGKWSYPQVSGVP